MLKIEILFRGNKALSYANLDDNQWGDLKKNILGASQYRAVRTGFLFGTDDFVANVGEIVFARILPETLPEIYPYQLCFKGDITINWSEEEYSELFELLEEMANGSKESDSPLLVSKSFLIQGADFLSILRCK